MSSNSERRLTCLWMDLKSSVDVAETPPAFERRCQVFRTWGFDGAAVTERDPDFIVVEFDYPRRQDMARAASFKQQFARVPMIVVSLQHSETLAVWFFRARFYDFLAQPLCAADVSRCLAALEHISAMRAAQSARTPAPTRLHLPAEATGQSSERTQLQPALTLVERSYHQRLLVTEVASHCNLPPFRFGRAFKEQFGMDFREYVLRYRIREACRLLRNPKASVTEVGYSVGFTEPSYFARMFKKLVGCPPSEVLGRQELDYEILEEKRA